MRNAAIVQTQCTRAIRRKRPLTIRGRTCTILRKIACEFYHNLTPLSIGFWTYFVVVAQRLDTGDCGIGAQESGGFGRCVLLDSRYVRQSEPFTKEFAIRLAAHPQLDENGGARIHRRQRSDDCLVP